MEKKQNRYLQIIESIFEKHYQRGATELEFTRDEIVSAAQRLKIVLPKNLGDVLYSLQNHLRTTAPGMGQVETDEIYIGMDKRGVHFVLPVQGKGGRDKIGVVQIEQDFAVCVAKFPALVCRPIAAQFMADDLIALFAFERVDGTVKVIDEKHYRLVRPDQLSAQELLAYQGRQA